MKIRKALAIVVVLAMMVSVFFTGCEKMDPGMTIKIAGTEFSLDCTVQEFLDAGFKVADINHPSHVISEDDFPTIGSMIMDQTDYYLISPDGEACNVSFNVYNKSTSDLSLADSHVYDFTYDAGTYAEYTANGEKAPEVLFNGISCTFTDCRETADAITAAGFKLDSAEVDDFCKDDMYSKSIISADGLFGHTLFVTHDYDYTEGVVRTNGFEMAIKLDYEFK